MSDIPDKYKAAAIKAWSASCHLSFIRTENPWEPIARALMAAAREADEAATKRERERCAGIANDLQYSADATFNDLTSRARKGEKHLELAAATAAGMSHQARKAAVTILKGEA